MRISQAVRMNLEVRCFLSMLIIGSDAKAIHLADSYTFAICATIAHA